jgi:hypothetical protein
LGAPHFGRFFSQNHLVALLKQNGTNSSAFFRVSNQSVKCWFLGTIFVFFLFAKVERAVVVFGHHPLSSIHRCRLGVSPFKSDHLFKNEEWRLG